MPLTEKQAEEIAVLLNSRNQLMITYTSDRVLKESKNYYCIFSTLGTVIACVEIKPVQWYQSEILHLTVTEENEGKGYAKHLLCEAERIARERQARILQCTIRQDNLRSRTLFERFGFRNVGVFFNEGSQNNVGIFQKILIPGR